MKRLCGWRYVIRTAFSHLVFAVINPDFEVVKFDHFLIMCIA